MSSAALLLALVAIPVLASSAAAPQPEVDENATRLTVQLDAPSTIVTAPPGTIEALRFHVWSVGYEPVRVRFEASVLGEGWVAAPPSPVVLIDDQLVESVLQIQTPSGGFYRNEVQAVTLTATPEPVTGEAGGGETQSLSFLVTTKGLSVPGAPLGAVAALVCAAVLCARRRGR